ncbi:MAG: helix-turn-helix domain-containing protein [Opitutaceae bacterium]|jgi:DNA-binding IclR family transcriptional regulator|nr:helix-turn-helix domain-containing protein [Opitutaceae bacterium]
MRAKKKNTSTRDAATHPHIVPVLLKALRVFAAIARGETEPTAKGLAVTLGISPTTCYRILQSFLAGGWLRAGTGGTFGLSLALVPLMHPLLRHELLIDTIREPLTALARTTGMTTKLSIRQGDSAVTVFVASSPRPTAISSQVGAVFPLALGSSGAAILATLPEAEAARILDAAPAEAWRYQKRAAADRRVQECRRTGCCFDTGSYQPQLHTVSTTVQAARHGLLGSITLLGFPHDFAPGLRPALLRELKFTAGGCVRLLESQGLTGDLMSRDT